MDVKACDKCKKLNTDVQLITVATIYQQDFSTLEVNMTKIIGFSVLDGSQSRIATAHPFKLLCFDCMIDEITKLQYEIKNNKEVSS